jgi:cobalt-zinc-cadmium resistance protein CzcA
MSIVTALTIPFSILFAFGLMVLTGHSANLISIGAIDFGILVDAGVIVLEHVFRALQRRGPQDSVNEVIATATADAARPVLFSTFVILVAFIPLFTMSGVPGRIFAPMSITYGFALAGALLFALVIAPVLATFVRPEPAADGVRDVRLVDWLRRKYARALDWALAHRRLVLVLAGIVLVATLVLVPFMGGEFMPKLEEGNIWVRATLPTDVSLGYASQLADQIRADLRTFPEVSHVVSQLGRPDDGTDATTFNNIEFNVLLRPQREWLHGLSKPALIHQMDQRLGRYPGVVFGFSQNIQDNVEEAMSGVKGENSLKLFGDDFDVLTQKADQIRNVMAHVRGVTDLGVFKVGGQPNLLIAIDRGAAARYGLMASDVDNAVQAAIGGIAATQILERDRRFDMVVRYRPEFRQDPDAIRNILLPTSDGGRVPLSQVATVTLHNGAFMIYRENDRRYIPIKFSIRGRDLATTMQDVQDQLQRQVRLPGGYHYEWAGEYDSLQKEQRRLMIVVPVSLAMILALLYVSFNSLADALRILAVLPFGAVGGILGLLITRTPFSISAAVGFASALGVGTLGASVSLAAMRHANQGVSLGRNAIRTGAMEEMRPVIMACLAAGLGLLPAAVSHGIGAQAQQPLARVVVGAMITTTLAILFLLPVFATFRTGTSAPLPSDETAQPEPAYH